MANSHRCSMCGRDRPRSNVTEIPVCRACDIAGEFVWPNDFYQWYSGMAYPGESENA